jgi:ankyrin repeat protein
MYIKRIIFFLLLVCGLLGCKGASAQSDTLALSHKLVLAVYSNSMDSTIQLLKQGAKLNYFDGNGFSALMYAVQNNNIDMVKLLIYNGANFNSVNMHSDNSLGLAARFGYFDIAEYLCYAGADPNKKNYDWLIPLHYAATYADYYMVDMLLFYKSDINTIDNIGNTPLHYAVLSGDTAVVSLLLRNGAIVNIKNQKNITPIHVAIQYKLQPVLKILMEADSTLGSDQYQLNSYLSLAIFYQNDSALNGLVKYVKSPVSIKNSPNNPLYIARMYNQRDKIKTLVSIGYRDSYQLHIADSYLKFSFPFNLSDRYFNLDFGIVDQRYKLDFYIGYGNRFKRKSILIPEGDSVFYQYRERRNILSIGVNRRFYPLNQVPNLYLFTGGEGQLHFGNYAGSNRNLEQNFFLTAQMGIAYRYKQIGAQLEYIFANWKIYRSSPHWVSLGVGFYWSNLTKPQPFIINWL